MQTLLPVCRRESKNIGNQWRTLWFHGIRLFPPLVFAATVMFLFQPWWRQGKVCAPLDIAANLYEPWADVTQPVKVKNHFATDAVEQYLLYHHHANQSFSREQRYGWNRLKSGGTPEYLNTMTASGDWSLQLHRRLPFWHAWHLGLMTQFLIAMLGMYRLLRSSGIPRGLSVLGGLMFGLNAHFGAWLYHRWTLGAFCWTPWWLWAMENLKQRKKAGLLTPGLLSLALLGGHLQFAVFHLIILGISGLDWMAQCRAEGGRPVRALAQTAAVGGIACGLAAFILLPSAVGYANTLALGMRRGGLGYPDGISGALLNALAYPAYVFPFAFGSPNSLDLFKLFRSDLMMTPYFGSLPALMAVIGWFTIRRRRNARWLAAAGLFLPLTPLLGPLYQRLLILWIIGGIWLAVLALHTMPDDRLARWRRILLTGYLGATLIFAAAGLVVRHQQPRIIRAVAAVTVRQARQHRFHARPDWFAGRAVRFVENWPLWRPANAVPWLLFGLSIHLLRFRRRRWFGYALALVIAPQAGMYSSQFMVFSEPFGEERALLPDGPETAAMTRMTGATGRIIVRQQEGRLPLFPPNTLSYFGIASIEGYDSILPDGFLAGINPATADAVALGSVGVTHLVAFVEDEKPGAGWLPAEQAGKIAIYSNVFAIPWYTVETGRGHAPVRIEDQQHNRRLLTVPPETRRLRILENWDEGWRYRANQGPWRRIQRTPDGSMTADVPPSDRESLIELDFSPRWKMTGLILSGLAAGLYMALGAGHWIVATKAGVGRR